jgi:hypothetical protein
VSNSHERGAAESRQRSWKTVHEDEGGITLLEASIAMAVLTMGLLGVFQMQVIAASSDGYAARVDRATLIARDLLTYLESIPYEADILQDVENGANGGDTLDAGFAFNARVLADGMFDFEDDGDSLPDELAAGSIDPCAALPERSCLFRGYVNPAVLGADPTQRPTLDFNGDGEADFERYWIVAEQQPGNPNSEGKYIAVIVRWEEPSVRAPRRVVMSTFRHNPRLLLP